VGNLGQACYKVTQLAQVEVILAQVAGNIARAHQKVEKVKMIGFQKIQSHASCSSSRVSLVISTKSYPTRIKKLGNYE